MKKKYYALISFVCSIGFGLAGLMLPPLGVIDRSVLIFIGQLLLFTASILGINFKINNKNEDDRINI